MKIEPISNVLLLSILSQFEYGLLKKLKRAIEPICKTVRLTTRSKMKIYDTNMSI